MNGAKFDLAGLCSWAVTKGLEHGEKKTELPLSSLGEHLIPLAQGAINNLGIGTIEIDPMMMAFGQLVMMGVNKQKERTRLREEANVSKQGDG